MINNPLEYYLYRVANVSLTSTFDLLRQEAATKYVLGETISEEELELVAEDIRYLKKLKEAYSLSDKGDSLCSSSKYEEARALYRKMLHLYKQMNNDCGVSWSLFSMGMSFFRNEEYAQATNWLQESIRLSLKTQDYKKAGRGSYRLGIALYQGSVSVHSANLLAEVIAIWNKGAEYSIKGRDYETAALCLYNLGCVLEKRRNLELAILSYLSSLEYYRRAGARPTEPQEPELTKWYKMTLAAINDCFFLNNLNQIQDSVQVAGLGLWLCHLSEPDRQNRGFNDVYMETIVKKCFSALAKMFLTADALEHKAVDDMTNGTLRNAFEKYLFIADYYNSASSIAATIDNLPGKWKSRARKFGAFSKGLEAVALTRANNIFPSLDLIRRIIEVRLDQISFCSKLGWKEMEAEAWRAIGFSYQNIPDIDEARKAFLKAIELARDVRCYSVLGHASSNLAQIVEELNERDSWLRKAAQYYEQAAEKDSLPEYIEGFSSDYLEKMTGLKMSALKDVYLANYYVCMAEIDPTNLQHYEQAIDYMKRCANSLAHLDKPQLISWSEQTHGLYLILKSCEDIERTIKLLLEACDHFSCAEQLSPGIGSYSALGIIANVLKKLIENGIQIEGVHLNDILSRLRWAESYFRQFPTVYLRESKTIKYVEETVAILKILRPMTIVCPGEGREILAIAIKNVTNLLIALNRPTTYSTLGGPYQCLLARLLIDLPKHVYDWQEKMFSKTEQLKNGILFYLNRQQPSAKSTGIAIMQDLIGFLGPSPLSSLQELRRRKNWKQMQKELVLLTFLVLENATGSCVSTFLEMPIADVLKYIEELKQDGLLHETYINEIKLYFSERSKALGYLHSTKLADMMKEEGSDLK